MTIINAIRAAAVLAGLFAGAAQASTVNFDVDGVGSSASVTDISCGPYCTADIDVTTAAGLDDEVFALEEGDSYTFDFLTFTYSGRGLGTYDVTATLAFELPGGSVTNQGDGGFLILHGMVIAGTLSWDESIQYVTLADGTTYGVSMQGGITFFDCEPITTTATVTLEQAPAPVPLPASALLLLGGVGGLGALRLKRRGSK